MQKKEERRDASQGSKALGAVVQNYAMYIALAVIFIGFQIISGGFFLTARNITNLINQTGYVAVLAVGMTLVLIICQIDLSVGYVAGFLGACAAQFLVKGMPAGAAILIVLCIGALIGLVEGVLIAKVGVPAFVTTLAFSFAARGMLTLVTESSGTVPVVNEFFISLSNGFLPAVFRVGTLHGLTLVAGAAAIVLMVVMQIRQRNELKKYKFETSSTTAFVLKNLFFAALIGAFTLVLADYNGISWTIVIAVVITGAYNFVLNRMTIGRYIYGMGGNMEAASLSGVDVKKILIGVFVSMGVMAALGGILYTSRLSSATPTAGNGFELDAIASCYIGGVSTSGGVGKVANSVVGAFVIMSLTNGLNLIGVGISYQYIIKGIIFVCAVAADVHSRGKKAV